jgi:hypothetical protein
MIKSKNVFVKIVSYTILGGFMLIIGVAMWLPDSSYFRLPFISDFKMTASTAALVNGEAIKKQDVAKFLEMRIRQSGRQMEITPELQKRALDVLIQRSVQVQFAQMNGINSSNAAAQAVIHDYFKDANGNFDSAGFKNFLSSFMYTLAEYITIMKEELVLADLSRLVDLGSGVSPEEIAFEGRIRGSKLQIKYAHLSAQDISTRFADKLTVTDEEVTAELRANQNEIKDPDADRARFRMKLQSRKLDAVKDELIKSLNAIAAAGGSVEEAAKTLGVTVGTSAEFGFGEPVTDAAKKEVRLNGLIESDIFVGSIMTIAPGKVSSAVSTSEGIFVYTPVKRDIKDADPATIAQIQDELQSMRARANFSDLIAAHSNKSVVMKNPDLEAASNAAPTK